MPYSRTITVADVCSTCVSTQGKKENCLLKVSGGNKRVFYYINRCDIDEISIDDATHTITQLNLKSGATWFSVTALKDTLTWTESVTLPNKFITQTIVFNITQLSDNADKELATQEAIDFAQELVNNDGELVMLIQSRTGVWRLYGLDNGLEISAGESISGAALADVSSNTLTFIAGETEYAHVVPQAVVAVQLVI